MEHDTSVLLFWSSLAVLVYTWFGYPAILFVLERCLYRPIKKEHIEPKVSVLVLAHNEEASIAAKIENLLALEYPKALLDIVIASDGSYDRTCDVVRRYEKQGVRLVEFPTRRGKPSVLNDTVPNLAGEIVLLVDVRQRLEPDVVRKMVANFADPAVGGVSGELVFERPEKAGVAVGMDTYWRYEKWIRAKEAGIDSTIGGTGAIFALRRSLFCPLPGETILDDVVLPMQIVRNGYRVVLEIGACAWDTLQTDWQREFARKARTLSGNFQVLANIFQMGAGLRMFGLIGFEYFSHKVMRLLGPLCLLLLLLTNRDLLATTPPDDVWLSVYAFLYYGQTAFYVVALGGVVVQGTRLRMPCLSLAYSFLVMQAAVVTGMLRFGSGRDDVLWEKAHAFDPASSRQRLVRLVWDSALFTAGFIFAYWIRYLGPPTEAAFSSYKQLFPYWDMFGIRFAVPLVMLIPLAIFYFFRVNETRTHEITPEYFLVLLKGVSYSTLLLFLVMYIKRASLLQPVLVDGDARIMSFPTSVLLIGFAVNCVTIGGWRMLLLWLREAGRSNQDERTELLLVGQVPPETGAVVESAYQPLGRIFATLPENDAAASSAHGASLRHMLGEVRPDTVVVAPALLKRDDILEAVAITDERCLPVNLLPGELELLLGRTPPRLSNYIPLLDLNTGGMSELYACGKRFVDCVIGLLLCVSGLPFLGTLLLAGRLLGTEGARPCCASVPRVGRNDRTRACYRLRFAAGWPRWWSRPARWCLIGWTLLLGGVSLVGMRPLLPSAYKKIDCIAKRFLRCRPGLFYIDRLPLSCQEGLTTRMAALVYYARNAGPATDLRILCFRFRRKGLV